MILTNTKTLKMLRLKKYTKTKSKPKPACKFQNCLHMCAYHYAQLLYTVQHRTVLIMFPLNLQSVITAHMLSIGGDGESTMVPCITESQLCIVYSTKG